jgi:hypothetical protein
VTVHLDDGRSFLKKDGQAVRPGHLRAGRFARAALGYSSLRLESFLFTEDSFRDVRRVLKPDGMFAMYNYYRQPWVVERLAGLARNDVRQRTGGDPAG